MWAVITAGIALGFVSSFHCVGMCGPLVLALPVQGLPPAFKKAAILLYHFGRLATYTILGLLIGLAGRHIFIAGYQRLISIVVGVGILLIVIINRVITKHPSSVSYLFFNVLKKYIQKLWGKTSLLNFTLLGALNGLLPCGMVYFALATCLSFGSALNSTVFMFAFGSGTLVLMLTLHFLGSRYISLAVRNKMRKAVPFMLALAGVLLVFRGLNLGIPYLSPNIGTSPSNIVTCH